MATATIQKIPRKRDHQPNHTFSKPWHSLHELHKEAFTRIELLGWIENMALKGSPHSEMYRMVFDYLAKNGNGQKASNLVFLMREIRNDIDAGLTLIHLNTRFDDVQLEMERIEHKASQNGNGVSKKYDPVQDD